AFAACNFLEVSRQTRDERWQQLALRLVDQVHYTLGRHREDDPRNGWISGQNEESGRNHPTMGGLRIGKSMSERKPDDPYDDRLEWERDGQYYHYLTRWMHALNRVSRSTGNPGFNLWAIELAKAAHRGFVHITQSGSKRMYWKMSIDLSYPLVPSMGQHDPLDGLITYKQLQATAAELSKATEPELGSEMADLTALCKGRDWATDDPLGIGGLLCDAYKVLQLIIHHSSIEPHMLEDLLDSSAHGLDAYTGGHLLKLPAAYRLPFRELGMSIGLHAVERMEKLMEARADVFALNSRLSLQMKKFGLYAPLSESIETFWLDAQNRKAQTWIEHLDINSIMLATSLAPDSYLEL
ncbi:MAG: hypothetical protein L7F78_06510, partial [Syntrophales bacterium LBB04]|nr:hypothetical protein [Syntrophales bacterium LBB04]